MEIRWAEHIRTLRKERGYTQEQLSEALGVTPGAVYKWESGRAVPELPMLVTLAKFFETSVDALLDYGWESSSMGRAAEKLHEFIIRREITTGMAYAEQALLKYPNSFDVVYRSAGLYTLGLRAETSRRAVELYKRAIPLLGQNTDSTISELTIRNQIATCYCYTGQIDEAISILKDTNIAGMNDYRIGMLLSQDPRSADEALNYLSDALGECYGRLYNICIGYANAYGAQERLQPIREMILWLYELGRGLRRGERLCWIDRGDVRLFSIMALLDRLEGKDESALCWLRRARDTALRFDAAPDYRTGTDMKFYHSVKDSTSYDDMGETAMDMIRNFMDNDTDGGALRPLWEQLDKEESHEEN